ncbi:hypothetical protein CC86DRAFT_10332 [Ophiobolus disseminans]|uniref:Uncharacterized protein n=1 Tax=Ophiobolus disseminans TaxID=1469910 RepID=A0A6A7AKH4_9PLEO|nr:hypothetical protein CC86DRAFT_10332 [Ophiobolus disseminans]
MVTMLPVSASQVRVPGEGAQCDSLASNSPEMRCVSMFEDGPVLFCSAHPCSRSRLSMQCGSRSRASRRARQQGSTTRHARADVRVNGLGRSHHCHHTLRRRDSIWNTPSNAPAGLALRGQSPSHARPRTFRAPQPAPSTPLPTPPSQAPLHSHALRRLSDIRHWASVSDPPGRSSARNPPFRVHHRSTAIAAGVRCCTHPRPKPHQPGSA